jgi:hypothetical protein
MTLLSDRLLEPEAQDMSGAQRTNPPGAAIHHIKGGAQ